MDVTNKESIVAAKNHIQEKEGRLIAWRYDRTRFPNALKVDRYENFHQNHVIVCEQDVLLTDFAELGILADMERRGWVLYL